MKINQTKARTWLQQVRLTLSREQFDEWFQSNWTFPPHVYESDRQALHASELSQETIDAIANAQVDPKHDKLNHLLDE